MVTISTKVLKGCHEIDMSVILFAQSDITARWSADLNLTSHKGRGEVDFLNIYQTSTLRKIAESDNLWMTIKHRFAEF